ncbi:hypothetical protein ACWDSJ_35905 [Nocardia sp. NPDC003482]
MPLPHFALSLLLGSPIPRRWALIIESLVREQRRIGRVRPPDKLSYEEGLVVSRGKAAGEAKRDQAARKLAELVAQADVIRMKLLNLTREAARLDDQLVTGVRGELVKARDAMERVKFLTATVTDAANAGQLKHRRVSPRLRRLIPYATVLDFPVLLWFVGSVFNVDWSNLTGAQGFIPLLTSIVFAFLATAVVALGLGFMGDELKGYKDDEGHIRLPRGRARVLPLTYVAFSIAVAVGAGVTMAYRIVADASQSGGSWMAASILCLFFAVIVMLLNLVVWSVHFRDGSTTTDELDHLAAQLVPIERRRVGLQREHDDLTGRLEALKCEGKTIADSVHDTINDSVVGAHQVVMLARSYHQGCGWSVDLLTPARNCNGLIAPLVVIDLSTIEELSCRLMGEDNAAADDESDENVQIELRGELIPVS